MDNEKKLRVSQVARRMDVSDKSIYRWLAEGRVFNSDKIIYINRSPRIPESEVMRVMNPDKWNE